MLNKKGIKLNTETLQKGPAPRHYKIIGFCSLIPVVIIVNFKAFSRNTYAFNFVINNI